MFVPLIVGIGGTSRPGSTSECAVIEALNACESLGAKSQLFNGEFLSKLPLYAPDRSIRDSAEADYINAIRSCHGLLVSTPGYHGSLSGTIKNALDLIEDTAKDDVSYLDGRAFGCIVTAYGWQACGTALISLRMIAHALRAWPTPYGATLNASSPLFASDGRCLDEKVKCQLKTVASQLVQFAHHREAGRGCGH